MLAAGRDENPDRIAACQLEWARLVSLSTTIIQRRDALTLVPQLV